jgi:hypothetical protein
MISLLAVIADITQLQNVMIMMFTGMMPAITLKVKKKNVGHWAVSTGNVFLQ